MTQPRRKCKAVSLRVTEEQMVAFEQAALMQRTCVSSFILDHAYEAAQEVIGDLPILSVSEQQWREICYALDNPPLRNPGIRKFMSSKSLFHENEGR